MRLWRSARANAPGIAPAGTPDRDGGKITFTGICGITTFVLSSPTDDVTHQSYRRDRFNANHHRQSGVITKSFGLRETPTRLTRRRSRRFAALWQRFQNLRPAEFPSAGILNQFGSLSGNSNYKGAWNSNRNRRVPTTSAVRCVSVAALC